MITEQELHEWKEFTIACSLLLGFIGIIGIFVTLISLAVDPSNIFVLSIPISLIIVYGMLLSNYLYQRHQYKAFLKHQAKLHNIGINND